MLLNSMSIPIHVFSLENAGVDTGSFVDLIKMGYEDYGDDLYLLRKRKIDYLRKKLSNDVLRSIDDRVWLDFYFGYLEESSLLNSIPGCDTGTLLALSKMASFRKRLVSFCELSRSSHLGWEIRRLPAEPFVQNLALSSEGSVDLRVFERWFKDLPDSLFCHELKLFIVYAAKQIGLFRPDIVGLKCIVHHTVVESDREADVSNSPEGIHQDGMDFIVSALVVERVNITGGVSVIYGSDRVTPILSCELRPGQGILQADLGSDLWHEVTSIHRASDGGVSYRSTVGLDFKVTKVV